MTYVKQRRRWQPGYVRSLSSSALNTGDGPPGTRAGWTGMPLFDIIPRKESALQRRRPVWPTSSSRRRMPSMLEVVQKAAVVRLVVMADHRERDSVPAMLPDAAVGAKGCDRSCQAPCWTKVSARKTVPNVCPSARARLCAVVRKVMKINAPARDSTTVVVVVRRRRRRHSTGPATSQVASLLLLMPPFP